MIEAVDRIPGPLSIPLLGTTWQLKWRIEGRFEFIIDC